MTAIVPCFRGTIMKESELWDDQVLDMGRAESSGAYQVWLNSSHPPEQFDQLAGRKAFPSFPDGYGLFAVVAAQRLCASKRNAWFDAHYDMIGKEQDGNRDKGDSGRR